jgi:hypothetical protein
LAPTNLHTHDGAGHIAHSIRCIRVHRASGVSRAMIIRWAPFVAAAHLAEGVPSETNELMETADPQG